MCLPDIMAASGNPIGGEQDQPEPSPFADAPPDMVNSRIIDPNAPRERTSYSDRNTLKDKNKSKLQAKPKEELPPPRTGSGLLAASGIDPTSGRRTKSVIRGSGVNI